MDEMICHGKKTRRIAMGARPLWVIYALDAFASQSVLCYLTFFVRSKDDFVRRMRESQSEHALTPHDLGIWCRQSSNVTKQCMHAWRTVNGSSDNFRSCQFMHDNLVVVSFVFK